MELLFLIIYAIPLVFIFSYSLIQLSLIISYLGSKHSVGNSQSSSYTHTVDGNLPFVTIQLPIYNERYVVERLIDAITAFEYPKERFEIQVLDDSTDETIEIIAQKVNAYQQLGFQINHIRRAERTGFKAGALAFGLKKCKGEFIAIFDADFVPPKDFLQETIRHFSSPDVGVVQTRWKHINENYSLLTQLQAFGLDAHFTIEQGGRNADKHFINFNGTAGVWRKSTIEDAGGWEADTLTEDLDLSYRAQMKDWRFVYLENVGCPAELPVTMSAVKSQQYRWTKGAAECVVKNLRKLLTDKHLGFGTKLHGFYHLMNSAVFVAVLLLSLLSVPMMFLGKDSSVYASFFRYSALFQVSWVILGCFYWISFQKTGLGIFEFIKRFVWFLLFMMGLSFHNSVAVVEGWLGKKTPFVRTPKFNVNTQKDSWRGNIYIVQSINKSTWIELFLMLYFISALIIELSLGQWGLVPFHLMLIVGYGSILYYTFLQNRTA
ncbi:glycosyl transferase family 2 [Emticicia oligotrophica DSM 17448]|uniref:Glycosyl transferase family 2 n=1 Tax=Emticicia oligotrophica (strain DSM 17448 / CIP 109782 / MTCC 6937 / GPTSA100-15) TaxID=929562 RepID=A0ABM5N1A4_EMTOG|nr:cellulose synthase family protein [Emticicia oligotrophica]AFK03132.1 glycosyl transferase family 2 [Emticicia oligotrophica DSM 17448]